jgi:hypothetical protein
LNVRLQISPCRISVYRALTPTLKGPRVFVGEVHQEGPDFTQQHDLYYPFLRREMLNPADFEGKVPFRAEVFKDCEVDGHAIRMEGTLAHEWVGMATEVDSSTGSATLYFPRGAFSGIPLDAIRGWELRERCALRYHRIAGEAYGVVLEGEEEGGTWVYAPAFPGDAREPSGDASNVTGQFSVGHLVTVSLLSGALPGTSHWASCAGFSRITESSGFPIITELRNCGNERA